MRLKDKVAIITGGGSGIGQASSYLFAKEGAKVIIAQRTESTGEETVANIRKQGGEAIYIRTDITIASQIENLIKETLQKYGKIDILFNNAGMALKRAPVENITEADWDRIYAVNVKGMFLAIKYAVPEMKRVKSGVIINTGSTLGVRPRINMSAYCSSKGAVILLTKALAVELAPFHIRINCVNPMVIDTPLQRQLAAEIGWDNFQREVIGRTPLARIATAEDCAYAALYLASDESRMLTGSCINVDGGSVV